MISKSKSAASFLLAFTLLFAFINWNGVKLTPDSEVYLKVVGNFTCDYFVNILIYWPPLYSVILNLFSENVLIWALCINYISLFVALSIWFYLGGKWIADIKYYLLYCFAVTCSTPVFAVSHFVWSESFFILLLSTLILLLYKYSVSKKPSWLISYIVTGILLCLQRHVGVVIIGGFVLGAILSTPRSWQLILSLSTSLMLGSSWLLVKFLTGHSNQFIELIPYLDIWRNLLLVSSEVSKWVIPTYDYSLVSVPILLLSIGFVIKCNLKTRKPDITLIVTSGLILYLFFFLLIPANQDDISRFMSVIYYPFVFMIFVFFQRIEMSKYKIIFYALSCIIISYKILRLASNAMMWHEG